MFSFSNSSPSLTGMPRLAQKSTYLQSLSRRMLTRKSRCVKAFLRNGTAVSRTRSPPAPTGENSTARAVSPGGLGGADAPPLSSVQRVLPRCPIPFVRSPGPSHLSRAQPPLYRKRTSASAHGRPQTHVGVSIPRCRGRPQNRPCGSTPPPTTSTSSSRCVPPCRPTRPATGRSAAGSRSASRSSPARAASCSRPPAATLWSSRCSRSGSAPATR